VPVFLFIGKGAKRKISHQSKISPGGVETMIETGHLIIAEPVVQPTGEENVVNHRRSDGTSPYSFSSGAGHNEFVSQEEDFFIPFSSHISHYYGTRHAVLRVCG
jgi:hypothetical protein